MQREAAAVRLTRLPSAEAVPVLGQGTWYKAEDPNLEPSSLDQKLTAPDLAELDNAFPLPAESQPLEML